MRAVLFGCWSALFESRSAREILGNAMCLGTFSGHDRNQSLSVSVLLSLRSMKDPAKNSYLILDPISEYYQISNIKLNSQGNYLFVANSQVYQISVVLFSFSVLELCLRE